MTLLSETHYTNAKVWHSAICERSIDIIEYSQRRETRSYLI
jgi:hypothetical protein